MDTRRLENRTIVAAWTAATAAVWLAACADLPQGGATTVPMPRAGSPEFILPSEAPRAGPLPRPGGPMAPTGSGADAGKRATPLDAGPSGSNPGLPGTRPGPSETGIEASRANSTPMPQEYPPRLPPPPPPPKSTDPGGGSATKPGQFGVSTSTGCKPFPCPTAAVAVPGAGPTPPAKPGERARVNRPELGRELQQRAAPSPREAAAVSKSATAAAPAAAPAAAIKKAAPAVQLDKAKDLDKKLGGAAFGK